MMKRLLALLLLLAAAPAFGGVTFDNTTNGKATAGTTELTAAPITLCAQFRQTASASDGIVTIGDTTSDSDFRLLVTSGGVIQADAEASGVDHATTTSTTTSLNTWGSACAVFTSSTSRSAYLNGGGKGTDTSTSSPSGVDTTAVGMLYRSSPGNFFVGDIAEVGIWSRALGDGEIAGIGLGYSPTCYANTTGYYRMLTRSATERDEFGSTRTDLTMGSGTSTSSTHPRITNCQ